MNAINWMMKKSEVQSYEADPANGWPANTEYTFTGRLPYRMVLEVKAYAKAQGATYHMGRTTSTLSWREGTTSYAFRTGSMKSTAREVYFHAQEVNE